MKPRLNREKAPSIVLMDTWPIDRFVSCLRLGNGDGTFGPDQTITVTLGPGINPAADFNNDGLLDATDGNVCLQQ